MPSLDPEEIRRITDTAEGQSGDIAERAKEARRRKILAACGIALVAVMGSAGLVNVISKMRNEPQEQFQTAEQLAKQRVLQEAADRAHEEAERPLREAQEAAQRAEEQAYLDTPEGRVWAQHQDWPKEICRVVAQNKLRIGMTAAQVVASVGLPTEVNKTITAGGTSEQWVYGHEYIYIDNGVLTVMQVSGSGRR